MSRQPRSNPTPNDAAVFQQNSLNLWWRNDLPMFLPVLLPAIRRQFRALRVIAHAQTHYMPFSSNEGGRDMWRRRFCVHQHEPIAKNPQTNDWTLCSPKRRDDSHANRLQCPLCAITKVYKQKKIPKKKTKKRFQTVRYFVIIVWCAQSACILYLARWQWTSMYRQQRQPITTTSAARVETKVPQHKTHTHTHQMSIGWLVVFHLLLPRHSSHVHVSRHHVIRASRCDHDDEWRRRPK